MSNSNLITQKNKYDKTGECLQSGLGAEQIFEQIALSKNLEVKTAKRRENIQKHIDSNTWQGKAGAYAIQETGDEFVEKLDGSLTNVMGLPMEMLQKLIKELLYRS